MSSSDRLWGIHMDAVVGTRPIDKGYVGIGWAEIGDLSGIPADRSAFKHMVQSTYPKATAGSVPVQAGVLFRFVHEVKQGDIIVYPSKFDRMVNLGKVEGPYRYSPELNTIYPNVRSVSWLKHMPREEFSQDALYEIGSFITLFAIRNHADEFLEALTGKVPSEESSNDDVDQRDDATVTRVVAAQAAETTQDFIIRQLKTTIDSYEFEHFIAHLLHSMGYRARVTQKSGDGGVDIIAHRDHLGFEPPVIKVQCKQVTSPIGRPDVTQLLGNVENGEHGLFVTLGSFSKDAREYDRSKPNLRLLDGEQLVELIIEHYDRFDPRYQALLPLKRIYVPSLEGAA